MPSRQSLVLIPSHLLSSLSRVGSKNCVFTSQYWRYPNTAAWLNLMPVTRRLGWVSAGSRLTSGKLEVGGWEMASLDGDQWLTTGNMDRRSSWRCRDTSLLTSSILGLLELYPAVFRQNLGPSTILSLLRASSSSEYYQQWSSTRPNGYPT